MKWWLTAIPALVGVVITAVLLLTGDEQSVVTSTRFAFVPLITGVVLAAIIVLAAGGLAAIRSAGDRGETQGRQQKQLEQRQFLYRLDHELKNPLTAISAGVAALDTEDSEAAIRTIGAQTQRLTRLLTDLRKLAELSDVALDRESVDLPGVVADAVDAASSLSEGREWDIQVSFPRAPRPLPVVDGDPDLLFLAVYNVIANAVKYSAAGDAIEIRGFEDKRQIVLEIADTGVGVAPEELELVWSELARGSRTLAVPGSGLGLPFARLIVERHGGETSLMSRAGEGTVVQFRLPATGS